MYIDWEKILNASYHFLLTTTEWGFKVCAVVAGWLTLGATGSFGSKMETGFGSLSQGLRRMMELPARFGDIGWTAREYQQMGAAEFREAYGMAPVNELMTFLSGIFSYFGQISANLVNAPLTSLTATLLVFLSFYLLGRIIRFARQQGRGSFLTQLEQKLGDRVFNRMEKSVEDESAKAAPEPRKQSLGKKFRSRQSSPKFT